MISNMMFFIRTRYSYDPVLFRANLLSIGNFTKTVCLSAFTRVQQVIFQQQCLREIPLIRVFEPFKRISIHFRQMWVILMQSFFLVLVAEFVMLSHGNNLSGDQYASFTFPFIFISVAFTI